MGKLFEFNVHIGDWRVLVQSNDIHDRAIRTRHIADNAITKEKLAPACISWDKLDKNLQNIVVTGGSDPHDIPLATEFGDSEILGISQKKLSEDHAERLEVEASLQDQINEIVSGSAIVNLSVSPSTIFVGEESTINLNATTDKNATSIKIKKDDTELMTGSGYSLSGTDVITPDSAGNITYSAEFTIAGLQRSFGCNVVAVYPIRIGPGAGYVEGTALTTPKASPAGTYNVAVANNGDYIFFNVPSTMTIHGATMSGFDFPLETPTDVTIDGVAYKSYRSSNAYDAGTLTIVIS